LAGKPGVNIPIKAPPGYAPPTYYNRQAKGISKVDKNVV